MTASAAGVPAPPSRSPAAKKALVDALVFAIVCFAPVAVRPAMAHPHVFVDTFDQIVGDGKGHLAAIRSAWKFDEMFSSSLLVEFDADRDGRLGRKELAKIASTILGSAKDYDTFTTLTAGGRRVPLARPDQVMALFRDGRLTLFLEMKPVKPLPLADGTFTLITDDPTYYVSFDLTRRDQTVLTDMPDDCRVTLTHADASDAERAWVRRVAGLGKAQTIPADGIDFAKLMATKVDLACN